jgi:hypothetical protein
MATAADRLAGRAGPEIDPLTGVASDRRRGACGPPSEALSQAGGAKDCVGPNLNAAARAGELGSGCTTCTTFSGAPPLLYSSCNPFLYYTLLLFLLYVLFPLHESRTEW